MSTTPYLILNLQAYPKNKVNLNIQFQDTSNNSADISALIIPSNTGPFTIECGNTLSLSECDPTSIENISINFEQTLSGFKLQSIEADLISEPFSTITLATGVAAFIRKRKKLNSYL